MRLPAVAALPVVAALVIACAGAPSSSATPRPTPTPIGSPSAPPPGAGLFLRATMTQAIAPIERFAWLPVVAITGDGLVIVPGAQPAIYPGQLVPPLVARSITEQGQAEIITTARDLGLLSGETDFTGGEVLMGGTQGRLQIVVDGEPVELIGDPGRVMQCVTAPCVPAPGSPEAFGFFWQQVTDLASWMPGDLGPEQAWDAPAYALVVGPGPDPGDLPQAPVDWPLELSLGSAGTAVGDQGQRCLTVAGDDAAALRPALLAANQLTPWAQDPETSVTFGLTVRPMLSGEDVCAEVFGVHG